MGVIAILSAKGKIAGTSGDTSGYPMVLVCALCHSVVLVCANLVSHVCAPRYIVMLQSSVFDCLTSY
jgi:hypothetical protein